MDDLPQKFIDDLKSIEEIMELAKGDLIRTLCSVDIVQKTNYPGLLSIFPEAYKNKVITDLKLNTFALLALGNVYKIIKEADKLKNTLNEADYYKTVIVRLESGDEEAWKDLYNHVTSIN